MNKNKGIATIAILGIILGVLVVGGGAYYVGTNKSVEKKEVGDVKNLENGKNDIDYDKEEEENVNIEGKVEVERESKIALKNNGSQEIIFYKSDVYGYSIQYSGIDEKAVNISSDQKNIMFFPNQSYIDTINIVDSTYVPAKYISLIGTVTFGQNSYKKYKDNVTPRHTYYLKTGLKNNKAIFISIEGDSDNPNYLNLASLKIDTINNSEESTTNDVVDQPAYLKSVYTKDGKNYITVDYIQMFKTSEERVKAMIEDGECSNTKDCYDFPNGYKRNINPLIRTFEVDPNVVINVYGEYNQVLNNGDLNSAKSLITFAQLKTFDNKSGEDYEQYVRIDVKNNKVTKIIEPYQE
jgi:hypothetical protein